MSGSTSPGLLPGAAGGGGGGADGAAQLNDGGGGGGGGAPAPAAGSLLPVWLGVAEPSGPLTEPNSPGGGVGAPPGEFGSSGAFLSFE